MVASISEFTKQAALEMPCDLCSAAGGAEREKRDRRLVRDGDRVEVARGESSLPAKILPLEVKATLTTWRNGSNVVISHSNLKDIKFRSITRHCFGLGVSLLFGSD